MALGLVLVIASATAAHAQDIVEIPGYPASIEAYDPREVALLPEYCRHTQLFRDTVPGGNNPERIGHYHSLLGETFNHMHHYCWGMMKTNRATLLVHNPQGRQSYLNSAIGEFDYVIQRAPENFVLLPEIMAKKGENLLRLGRGPVAMIVFERAAAIKPDYWPPYAQMSDYYKERGDVQKARESLEKGLSFAPDAAPLKRRLAELKSSEVRRPVQSR
jgi:tetratricopeptide (TPR) repeat protein